MLQLARFLQGKFCSQVKSSLRATSCDRKIKRKVQGIAISDSFLPRLDCTRIQETGVLEFRLLDVDKLPTDEQVLPRPECSTKMRDSRSQFSFPFALISHILRTAFCEEVAAQK